MSRLAQQLTRSDGSGKNQMTKITRDALNKGVLEVRSNDGTKLGAGAKVRITGSRASETTSGCSIMYVDLIEKA